MILFNVAERWSVNKTPAMQGAEKIVVGAIHESPLRVRRNDDVPLRRRGI